MDELSAPAPAKINLTLEILGKRSDGYHEIRTVMQTVELADLVTVRSGRSPGISVEGPWAAGVPSDESNLAWRAAQELARRTGHSTDHIRIAITKRIPAAGGLGGGASDAATTLRLLQRLWAIEDDAPVLASANAIGSDEAFFLAGGTALASGRGDVVEALPPISTRGVVLFLPHDTIETKTASLFRAYAGQPFDDGDRSASFVRNIDGPVSVSHTFNAFERVAFEVFGGLAGLRDEIEAVAGIKVRLAGAGPALFWIGDENQAAEISAACSAIDCEVVQTATVGSLWRR